MVTELTTISRASEAQISTEEVSVFFHRLKEIAEKFIRDVVSNELSLITTVNAVVDYKQNTKQYYSTNEVLEHLGISRSTLFRWVKNGTVIKYYFNGVPRYDLSEINQMAKVVELKKGGYND